MPITFLPPIYYPGAAPATITRDGVTFDRIERLPRNVRPGDLVRLFDGNSPTGPREAYVTVRDVDSWPKTVRGHRVSMAETVLRLIDAPWWWGRPDLTFYGSQTHEPFTVYRRRK